MDKYKNLFTLHCSILLYTVLGSACSQTMASKLVAALASFLLLSSVGVVIAIAIIQIYKITYLSPGLKVYHSFIHIPRHMYLYRKGHITNRLA